MEEDCTIVSMFSKQQQGPELLCILPHQASVLQIPGMEDLSLLLCKAAVT